MAKYTNEQLLQILASYARMIDRDGRKYNGVVLDDIRKSIAFVLSQNGMEEN